MLSMPVQGMGEGRPLPGFHELRDASFHVARIGFRSDAEPQSDAEHMGIHDDPRRPEAGREDQVGRLSAHPGKGQELIHALGNPAAVPLFDRRGRAHEVSGLRVEKADAMDDLLQFLRARPGHGGGVGPSAEELGRHPIHLLVGALGGEDDSAEKFEAVMVVKEGRGVRPERHKTVMDSPDEEGSFIVGGHGPVV